MRCGIEFEYLLVDGPGPHAGRIRDFSNLDFAWISQVLADKPGCHDASLATGDLGIKRGYWYLEGDERFHADGRFACLAVKGVEIRTPPAGSVDDAIATLLAIEAQLSTRLAEHGLALGIVGFNPCQSGYAFTPPLNDWEVALRQSHRAYDGSLVSTMSYGPDINLSWPAWSPQDNLRAAHKLNAYAPYIVPFSFSSPFYNGQAWAGCSKRTWERSPWRPAVKLYLSDEARATLRADTSLVHPPRLAQEAGRIEFKAFDAFVSLAGLRASAHLLVGLCLDDTLPAPSEQPDVEAMRRAAMWGFADPHIHEGASAVLAAATRALQCDGQREAVLALAPLQALLNKRSTPADALRAEALHTGHMYRRGGLRAAAPCPVPTEPMEAMR